MPPGSKKKLSKQRQHNATLGQRGEERARSYLQRQGWQIIASNVTFGTDELDLVAREPDSGDLVFVEVKTRGTDFAGDPAEAINERKLAALIRAGYKYIQAHQYNGDYRFDAIAVLPDKIEHFVNITWP